MDITECGSFKLPIAVSHVAVDNRPAGQIKDTLVNNSHGHNINSIVQSQNVDLAHVTVQQTNTNGAIMNDANKSQPTAMQHSATVNVNTQRRAVGHTEKGNSPMTEKKDAPLYSDIASNIGPQNIYREDDDMDKDIKQNGKEYAKKQGIKILSAFVIHNKYRSDVVGCKIRIPVSQQRKALDGNVWPSEIKCHLWKQDKPMKKG